MSSKLLNVICYQIEEAQKEINKTHIITSDDEKIPMVLTGVEFFIEVLFGGMWKIRADNEGTYFKVEVERHSLQVARNLAKSLCDGIILSVGIGLEYRDDNYTEKNHVGVKSEYIRRLASAHMAEDEFEYDDDYFEGSLSLTGLVYTSPTYITERDLERMIERAINESRK